MKSIVDDVGRNERQIIQGRKHWAALIPPILFALLWEIACLGIFISDVVEMIRFGSYEPGGGVTAVETIFLMLFGFIVLLYKVMCWRATQLLLTDKVLYGRSGFFWTSYKYIPNKKISYIFVYKGIFAKLFGYGTIKIATSGGRFKFHGIADPDEFRAMVLDEVKHFEEKD